MLYDWLQHISFANQWVFPLLLMVPVLAWIWFRTQRSSRATFLVSSSHLFVERTLKTSFVNLPFIFRLLCLTSLIIALARPQIKDVQSRAQGEGIAIVLCIDVSGSMLSKDFYPNRMEAAKDVAAEFVKARPVDQIGLVVFSGESFMQYPISTDREGLLEQIGNIKSGMLQDGTLIGEGLANAVQRLMDVQAKSKVVIMLTDGKEEAPPTRIIDPMTALEIAKAKGVKVYTVGMASDEAEAANERYSNQTGNHSPLIDETLLRTIATQTGGAYYRAKDKSALQIIYGQIDRMEKSNVQIIKKARYSEEFVWFIMAALLFLVLELILKYSLLRTFP